MPSSLRLNFLEQSFFYSFVSQLSFFWNALSITSTPLLSMNILRSLSFLEVPLDVFVFELSLLLSKTPFRYHQILSQFLLNLTFTFFYLHFNNQHSQFFNIYHIPHPVCLVPLFKHVSHFYYWVINVYFFTKNSHLYSRSTFFLLNTSTISTLHFSKFSPFHFFHLLDQPRRM